MEDSGSFIHNDYLFKIISRVVEPLLSVFSLVANIVILIAFARCRQLRRRTFNLLLIFLAIADLLFVIVTVPFGTMIHFGYPHDYYGCLIIVSLTTVPIHMTVSALLVIAVDRFVAIRWPFNHARYCSRSILVKSVLILWSFNVFFNFLTLAGFNMGWINDGKCSYHLIIDRFFRAKLDVFATLLPLLVMCVIYGYIFHVVIKMSKTVGPVANAEENRSTAFTAAKKCSVIVVAFVVFILPITILNFGEVLLGFRCSACMRIGSWGLLFHGFVCPVIYLYQNKLLRTVVALTLRCRPIEAFCSSVYSFA